MTESAVPTPPEDGYTLQAPPKQRRYWLVIVTAVVTALLTSVVVVAFAIYLESVNDRSAVPPDPTGAASRGCNEQVRALYFTVEADAATAQAHTIAANALFAEAGGEWANRDKNQHRHRGNDSAIDGWCHTLLKPVRNFAEENVLTK